MRSIYRKFSAAVVAAVLMHGVAGMAGAEVISTNFANPAFFGQANTTYQFWNGFTTSAGPNAPSAITNAAASVSNIANAYDASGGGAADVFLLGTPGTARIYSPNLVTLPTVIVPSLGFGANWTTQIVLQTEISGSLLDTTTVTVTPSGGQPVTVALADWTSVASPTPGRTDYRFSWNLVGSATSYTLKFNATDSSSSWAGVRVDTLTVPVPEPASLGVLGLGAGLLAMRRRRGA